MISKKFVTLILFAACIALADGMSLGAKSLVKRQFAKCGKKLQENAANSSKRPPDANVVACYSGHFDVSNNDATQYKFAGEYNCYDKFGIFHHRNGYTCFYVKGVNSVTFFDNTGEENLSMWHDKDKCDWEKPEGESPNGLMLVCKK